MPLKPSEDDDRRWHVDRKVNIGIIAALVLQFIGLVAVGSAWKADVNSRLGALERTDESRTSHEQRIIVLEQKLNYIADGITEIKQAVKQK